MEFSYRVDQNEYKQAFLLRSQQTSLISGRMKTVMFWIFILVCLTLLWSIVQKRATQTKPHSESPVVPSTAPDTNAAPSSGSRNPAGSSSPHTGDRDANVPRALLFNIGPFILLAAIWFFMLKNMGGKAGGLPGMYNRDPLMQGQFTVNITTTSISIKNTAGFTGQLNWYLFEDWRESNSVIVLNYKSGNFNILNIGALSESQKSELRGILAAALPQK